jgi:hypothetical protein
MTCASGRARQDFLRPCRHREGRSQRANQRRGQKVPRAVVFIVVSFRLMVYFADANQIGEV